MTRKIFRSICTVAIAVFLASLVLIMGVLYDYFSAAQLNQLRTETLLCAAAVESGGLGYLNRLTGDDYRITWISAEGTVLFDNKADTGGMENHMEREEIKEALSIGTGESSRYSDTLMERQFYCARRLSDGTVLRLSDTHLTWWSLMLGVMQPIVVVITVAIALSFFLAYRISKRIVKPLNEMDLDAPEDKDTYEELAPLIKRIKNQQAQLKLQEAILKQKKDEFDAATRNMSEGILLLNESGSLISINETASRLLAISSFCIGKDLLLFNNSPEIKELLQTAEAGERGEKTLRIGELEYQISASPVLTDGKVSGIAMILSDITEKEKGEQARREFTANVSHELKTPLQTISGSAELLASGMVRAEEVSKFSNQIYTEARRMIALIEDIIKLSHLDEGAEDMKWQETDMYAIAETTVRNMTPVAENSGIKMSLSGSSAKLVGIPQLLLGIVYNLCDNAVKYNRSGGSVNVDVRQDEKNVILSVSDTGIGIPLEAQSRVFERFYRVDKSRSKSVGGTGLGLSIVKHSVKLHGGEIELRSALDKGTTVTVILPKGEISE